MLSNEEQSIYDILLDITGDGDVYKIVDADEIIERLPAEVSLTKVQLSHIIRDLRDRDYLSIKFFTPDEYCLLALRQNATPQTGDKKALPSRAQSGAQPAKSQSVAQVVQGQEIRIPADRLKSDKKQTVNLKIKLSPIFWVAFFGAALGSAIIAAIAILIVKFV